jgi:hypothetical protein
MGTTCHRVEKIQGSIMAHSHLWIEGYSRSGKTQRALEQLRQWQGQGLILTTDSSRRYRLEQQLHASSGELSPIALESWQGWVQKQVLLFFPLLAQVLQLPCRFPVVLRVEKEQELAQELWRSPMAEGRLKILGVSPERMVRRLLDLYLLAANSGKNIAVVGDLLAEGWDVPLPTEAIADALQMWQEFCYANSLLTYGLCSELFGQYLLTQPRYTNYLRREFAHVWIESADELPAIACQFTELMMSLGAEIVITFNPEGSVRAGLGADAPLWQETLRPHCTVISLPPPANSLVHLFPTIQRTVFDPTFSPTTPLPELVRLEAISRSAMLRLVSETIAQSIHSQKIRAEEIAIIAPGMDAIARYTITQILQTHQIPIFNLAEHLPLNQSIHVRSLLSLFPLFYPKLGRLINKADVAEMLPTLLPAIDPVRAGMLAEYCFKPDIDRPELLEITAYPEWHRLGYCATEAYNAMRLWLEEQRQNPPANPLIFLDRAIQQWLRPQTLSYQQIMPLRALVETAQHHWETAYRLSSQLGRPSDHLSLLTTLISNLRQGMVTANPLPQRQSPEGVTLSTIYQYRMHRGCHRWQFWLDIGSNLWLEGGSAVLYGAPLFQSQWQGQWNSQLQDATNQERLRRIFLDLLCRCTERVYLGYSELNVKGQIQSGFAQALLDIAS